MRSFIRWAGSKRMLLPQLRLYWTGGRRRYIEPFCGSACLFFDVQPEQAILGDLNEELVCALRAIRSQPYVVLECLNRLPRGRSGYYSVRKAAPSALAEADRAARFLYLNHYCFNGIYRTNAAGAFNVPYGPPKSGRPLDESLIIDASKALRNTVLTHGDFERTLEHVQPGDFVYLDPPYCLDSRRVFKEYLPRSFALCDLDRLRRQLLRLDGLGVTFVVSYADCSQARELLGPWAPRRIRTRRHIAGFTGHRRSAYELIATNVNSHAVGEEP